MGEVTFESNSYIMNSAFDIDIFIDGNKIGSFNNQIESNNAIKDSFNKKILVGVHHYEIKVYSYNGQAGKSIKGKIVVQENKRSEIFIDFKEYNNWI
jgi:hypothetical protein